MKTQERLPEVKIINERIDYPLLKSQKLALYEFGIVISWDVNEDQILTVRGDNREGTNWFHNYRVDAKCILVSDNCYRDPFTKIALDGKTPENPKIIHTSTDRGGHELVVIDGNQIKVIADLCNGFGDGNYRLKFVGNSLVR